MGWVGGGGWVLEFAQIHVDEREEDHCGRALCRFASWLCFERERAEDSKFRDHRRNIPYTDILEVSTINTGAKTSWSPFLKKRQQKTRALLSVSYACPRVQDNICKRHLGLPATCNNNMSPKELDTKAFGEPVSSTPKETRRSHPRKPPPSLPPSPPCAI